MKKTHNRSVSIHQLILISLMILISCGLSACNNSKAEDTVTKVKVNLTPIVISPLNDEAKKADTESDSSTIETQNIQDHDAGYYLNRNEAVMFQQATWNFAKAYFSADKEMMKKYLDIDVEAEVFDKDVFDQLSRLILKWNPEELSTDQVMSVQYEFILEGEDSCTYLNMALEYQNELWVVTDYNLEK